MGYKSSGDRNKEISVEEYVNKIKSDLNDILMIWKNLRHEKTNFISFKDNDKGQVMHSESDKIEIMINDEADRVIEELFESILNKYQNDLEKSMKGNEFVFNYAHLLYYECHKINPNCDRSNGDSPTG